VTNIRRYYLPDSVVFLTAACHDHQPLLRPEGMKSLLLEVMREVKAEQPFSMLAWVILDDHFHCLIRPESPDFSRLMHAVKTRFAHRRKAAMGITGSAPAWQRRFWDHLIRNEDDLARHLDYIHFNPVRHGYAPCPGEYPYSSFKEYLARGNYTPDWGKHTIPFRIEGMSLEGE